MNQKNKKYLLQLSRRTLEKYFQSKEILQVEEDDLPNSLKEMKGVFISLWKNQSLRGCIGNLEGKKPIIEAVIENSLASALFDPRFSPLTEEELADIKIEISIIEPLKRLPHFEKAEDLLNYLAKNKPGLLIKKGALEATFLPQVWEELNSPELFLSNLCQKAGLAPDEWKKMNLEMFEYQADVFKE
jgi:AmmeMemoRadiSam system protein A